jgi:hypothetical protein
MTKPTNGESYTGGVKLALSLYRREKRSKRARFALKPVMISGIFNAKDAEDFAEERRVSFLCDLCEDLGALCG